MVVKSPTGRPRGPGTAGPRGCRGQSPLHDTGRLQRRYAGLADASVVGSLEAQSGVTGEDADRPWSARAQRGGSLSEQFAGEVHPPGRTLEPMRAPPAAARASPKRFIENLLFSSVGQGNRPIAPRRVKPRLRRVEGCGRQCATVVRGLYDLLSPRTCPQAPRRAIWRAEPPPRPPRNRVAASTGQARSQARRAAARSSDPAASAAVG